MRARNKSCVVSCRVPNELKTALDTLACERSVMLSHVMRKFLEEAVRCGDLYHWKEPESVRARRDTLTPCMPAFVPCGSRLFGVSEGKTFRRRASGGAPRHRAQMKEKGVMPTIKIKAEVKLDKKTLAALTDALGETGLKPEAALAALVETGMKLIAEKYAAEQKAEAPKKALKAEKSAKAPKTAEKPAAKPAEKTPPKAAAKPAPKPAPKAAQKAAEKPAAKPAPKAAPKVEVKAAPAAPVKAPTKAPAKPAAKSTVKPAAAAPAARRA